MKLDNLDIGNNVSFSNNGIKLDAPLKFVSSSDTNIDPPAGETWMYIHKYPTVTGTLDTALDVLRSSGETGFTYRSAIFEANDLLIGGIATNTTDNISVPISDNTNNGITHPTADVVSGTLWSNGDSFRVDGPVRIYFVYNCGSNNYYYALNLTSSLETLNANDTDVNSRDIKYIRVTSDAPVYNSGGGGTGGGTGGDGKTEG